MKKNWLRLTSLVLLMAVFFTAIPFAMAQGEGKEEIVVWNQIFEDWNREWFEEKVAEFNADPEQKYSVKLEFVDGAAWDEKLASARAAGTMADVFQVNYSNLIWNATDGYIMPLNDLIPQESWEDLYDNVKEMITVDGKLYAYPQMLEPAVVMYYRKDLLQEAGLEVPKTWDEFAAAAKALTNDDMYGAAMHYDWSLWGWEFTAAKHWPIADDWASANVQDEGYVDLLTFIKNLYEEEVVPLQALTHYNEAATSVADESIAMAFSGSWGTGGILANYHEMADKIGVAAAPTKDGSPFQSTVGGWTYVVDAKSQKAEGAAAFINWIFAEDAARTGSFFEAASFSKYATRKSVDEYLTQNTAAKDDEWMQAISTQIIPYAISEPIYSWDISQAVLTAVGEVVTNGVEVNDALTGAADAINQYIENNDYSTKKP